MAVKVGELSTKVWLRGPFVCDSLSAMADSNSCALVITLQKEKRVVALPRLKFVDNMIDSKIELVNVTVYPYCLGMCLCISIYMI